jgi:hypothetical protein
MKQWESLSQGLELQSSSIDPYTGRPWEGDPVEIMARRRFFEGQWFLSRMLEGVAPVTPELVRELARTVANYVHHQRFTG